MTFGDRVLDFYKNIGLTNRLPKGVEAMNPYEMPQVITYVELFLKKYFSDNQNRVFVFGINPGRFGAGLTGVTFTDPVALEKFCGVKNDLLKKRELSSEFIYRFIEHWGGVEKFYKDYFLTAVSPLGFVRNGKNYNYYDEPTLLQVLKPFIVETLGRQIAFGARQHAAILLGTGKNQKMFAELNQEHRFFKEIYALDHPRFIMQYRRRLLPDYLKKYKEVFSLALSK